MVKENFIVNGYEIETVKKMLKTKTPKTIFYGIVKYYLYYLKSTERIEFTLNEHIKFLTMIFEVFSYLYYNFNNKLKKQDQENYFRIQKTIRRLICELIDLILKNKNEIEYCIQQKAMNQMLELYAIITQTEYLDCGKKRSLRQLKNRYKHLFALE